MRIDYRKDRGEYRVREYRGGGEIHHGYYGTLREAQWRAKGHHWIDGIAPDPQGSFGFVYEIRDSLTSMGYVGMKQYRQFNYPCDSSNNMDRLDWKESCWTESDWQFYTTSSKLLSPIIEARPQDFQMAILSNHRSKLSLVKAEIEAMEARDVLYARLPDGSRAYYNQHIGGAEYSLISKSGAVMKNAMSYHPLYQIWRDHRKLMGGEWMKNPEAFIKETGAMYKEGAVLQKVRSEEPLHSWNYRWVLPEEE